jgi:hypothetical protein
MTQNENVVISSRRPFFFALLFVVCAVIFGLVFGYLYFQYINTQAQLQSQALQSADEQSDTVAQHLNEEFGQTMQIAQSIADDLTSGALRYDLGIIRLRAELNKNMLIDGLSVAFQPFVYEENTRLYQYYVSRDADGKVSILEGATYDYTLPPSLDPEAPYTSWYYNPLNLGAQWTDPFFATGAQTVLVEYSVPFFYNDADGIRRAGGVVTIDYSLESMTQLVNSLELGKTGYGFLVSDTGMFLAHPDASLIGRKTIYDLTRPFKQTDIAVAVQDALRGNESFIEGADPVTGEPFWAYIKPVAEPGWVMGVVISKSDFGMPYEQIVREETYIVIASALSVYFLILLIFRVYRGDVMPLWVGSMSFTGVCIAIIVAIWMIIGNTPNNEGVVITSVTTANRYIENYEKTLSNGTKPTVIPSGILVQALEFPNATSVAVNGYIWQRYPMDYPEVYDVGFLFQDSIATQRTVELISETEEDGEIVRVWYFADQLYQAFDPVRYPFDVRPISIRIAPRDFSGNVVLVPDLTNYLNVNPSRLPGIDQTVAINNWTIESSGFSFLAIDYNVDFGIETRENLSVTPELFFVVNATRNITGTFIAYTFPALIVIGLLFAFMLHDREPDNKEILVTALNYSATIFFVIAVAHSSLRDNIAAVGITYMEYLYIVLYLGIIGVAVETFLFVKTTDSTPSWLLMPKLLFLPLIFGFLLVVTLAIFIWV